MFTSTYEDCIVPNKAEILYLFKDENRFNIIIYNNEIRVRNNYNSFYFKITITCIFLLNDNVKRRYYLYLKNNLNNIYCACKLFLYRDDLFTELINNEKIFISKSLLKIRYSNSIILGHKCDISSSSIVDDILLIDIPTNEYIINYMLSIS